MRTVLLACCTAAVVAGCATTPGPSRSPGRTAAQSPPPAMATTGTLPGAVANLAPASGSLVSGRLMLAPVPGGVRIRGDLGGFQPGSTHGFHVHQVGDCSAADASSAGGHFNPTGSAHGRAGSGAHHLGDIDNIRAGADGVAHVDAPVAGAVLGGGAGNDLLGRAIVVHAGADDYVSQPSGDAGARIACGVIQTGP